MSQIQQAAPRQPPPSARTFAQQSPYLHRSLEFTYRARFFLLSPKSLPPAAKPRPNVPLATHELLLAMAGVIVEKWEKLAGWVLAALAAVSGLAVSNYEKVVAISGAGAVRNMLWLLLAAAILHALQKVFTTFVQSTEAGAKAGKAMDLDPMHPDDATALMAGMIAAYPPWPAKLLAWMFARMRRNGIAPFSKLVVYVAFGATACAGIQLLLGIAAIVVVALSLY